VRATSSISAVGLELGGRRRSDMTGCFAEAASSAICATAAASAAPRDTAPYVHPGNGRIDLPSSSQVYCVKRLAGKHQVDGAHWIGLCATLCARLSVSFVITGQPRAASNSHFA